MPAKSEKQKRFMRTVLAFKKGEISSQKVSDKIKSAAKSMTLKQIEDFVNKPINESEENISTIQTIKNKTFDQVLEENQGIKFDIKELSALQSKQEGFAGVNSVKFVLNKNKLDEIKTEVFSNGVTKICVLKKLIDNDTKSLNNYALFVQSIDENKQSKKIYFLLSSLFNDKDDSKIKTLTDFIDRFNSYAL